MAKILLLGFISGFPWLLISPMLSLWLKEEGVSRTGIGFFGIIFSVYAVNVLWAPLIDKLNIPLLAARFGKRRAWILLMQAIIALAMVGMFCLPNAQDYTWWVALFAFIIALASATQDIGIDALRIEMFGENEPEKIGGGSAMATSGWWLGFGGGKVLALPLVAALQMAGMTNAWQAGYLSLIIIVGLCVVGVIYFIPAEPNNSTQDKARPCTGDKKRFIALWRLYRQPLINFIKNFIRKFVLSLFFLIIFLKIIEAIVGAIWGIVFYKEISFFAITITLQTYTLATIIAFIFAIFPWQLYAEPLLVFIQRFALKPALLLLFFIIFFKIGEAFLGKMSIIFYKEIGFSKSEIALLSGGLGTITVCVFAIFGSFINAKYGLMKGIIVGGMGMALTNLLFVALAYHPEKWLFVVAVVADQFTTAVSTVAFVAFISQLCDRKFAATHYAALASLGNLSRTVFAASSGLLVDNLEKVTNASEATGFADAWALFFVITVVMVLPSLFIIYYLRNYLAPLMRGVKTRLL